MEELTILLVKPGTLLILITFWNIILRELHQTVEILQLQSLYAIMRTKLRMPSNNTEHSYALPIILLIVPTICVVILDVFFHYFSPFIATAIPRNSKILTNKYNIPLPI